MPSTITRAKSSLPSSGLVPGNGSAYPSDGRTKRPATTARQRMATPQVQAQRNSQWRLYAEAARIASVWRQVFNLPALLGMSPAPPKRSRVPPHLSALVVLERLAVFLLRPVLATDGV